MGGKQTVRQLARSRAREARAKVRQEQVQRERRLARWGEQVAVALAERDAMVDEYEQRAGQALRSMVEEEGLSTGQAVTWCGVEGLTAREAHRLIHAAEQGAQDQEHAEDQEPGDGQEQSSPDGGARLSPDPPTLSRLGRSGDLR